MTLIFRNSSRLLPALLAALWVGCWGGAPVVVAQGTGGGGATQGVAGVDIDAQGVLRKRLVADPGGLLSKRRAEAARAMLPADLARESDSRKVSLTRLEKRLGELLAEGKSPTEEMKYLAGLTRVRHVFYYPETKDVVIEGPAEGFMPDLAGRVVGLQSGAAVLELQDLAVALRAFPPSGAGAQVISVSIDPTKEGLARMQQFLRQLGPIVPGDAQRIALGLKESLGVQEVSIRGVAPTTHFAQVLVEADYRMKLIGIGLETPPVKIESYVSRANPAQVARNALERWYFTPNYECVMATEDGFAMELVGDGVRLIGESERVTAEGARVDNAGGGNAASQQFVRQFTEKYGELAKKSPVYAQMRNLIDLAIASAYIQQRDFYGQAAWSLEVLGDENRFPVETHLVPRQVESAVNVVWKGNRLMTPIGGGVNIQPRQALSPGSLRKDTEGTVAAARAKIDTAKIDAKRWWWD
ncbi:MAG: DUF1598 domain-containing protein [Planctomycetota bacterium]